MRLISSRTRQMTLGRTSLHPLLGLNLSECRWSGCSQTPTKLLSVNMAFVGIYDWWVRCPWDSRTDISLHCPFLSRKGASAWALLVLLITTLCRVSWWLMQSTYDVSAKLCVVKTFHITTLLQLHHIVGILYTLSVIVKQVILFGFP